MVDKGFRIETECADNNITLIRPAFKTNGEQLSKKDTEDSREIAAARVNVERVMEQLKNFEILKSEVQWHYLAYMNDIIISIAALVNLGPPLLGSASFA